MAVALSDRPAVQGTPVKAVQNVPEVRIEEVSPPSDTKRGRTSVASVRVPSDSPPRIEDSVEALDQLEDQLEAFGQAAHVTKIVSPPKRVSEKGLASLQPPKPLAKSTKAPTMPAFELPGEAVARRLKEKREARLSMQATREQATAPATGSIRRTKSARAPTVPKFELPGEAISRRKREEREARLKAQEEEERKRREFKARPIRSGATPASIPRETITSRARQKGTLPENAGSKPTTSSPNKRGSMIHGSREPLSHVNNQSQPRGRHLASEDSTTTLKARRPTSSSTNSLGSKRGSMSVEEAQQQRLRGKDIYQRENSYTQDREKERREREAMARIAREQAAEASRLRSREWAEKQKRKRMTVGSMRDLVA